MLTHGHHTIYTMLEKQALQHPSKEFLVFEDANYSYTEMLQRVNQLARWFEAQGVEKGDTVAAFLSNSPLFYETWFACGAIGAILLPINTAATASELDYFLEHSESKGFLYEADLINNTHLETAHQKSLRFCQVSHAAWYQQLEQYPNENIAKDVSPSDVVGIMYTSGTTAKPKGVLITHENYLFAGHSSVLYQQLTPNDRYLVFLPLFHVNSQYYTSMAMLVCGGTIVLEKRFSSSTFWDTVDQHKPTVTSMVATTIKMLLEKPQHPKEATNSLRQAGYGLFVPTPDLKKFQSRFGVKLFQWYGMTESITTNIVVPLYEDMPVDPETGISSIGKAALGHQVKIIDEQGQELPPKQVGQIIVKGPSFMKGYYKNPEATAQSVQNGWLYTGDNGYFNEEGFIWFVDRNKDMIKRAGENISSIEIENILSNHPAIQACAVIGEPDPLREEAVIAYVKLYDGAKLEENELHDFCAKDLSYFKVPQEFRILDDFPRTSIGKIQKNLLRGK
ncbi:hypothetical protein Plano_2318 [Planococcus sp. PAMC 21323]|uniref:class I adenylate-forming enzyme family protein n=1 Tax=Planococcus sp. PAMC 21323 TaxID=1526927 RepID=UPI000571F341|nr:AMP-binding protein [Planococcus sp. PAMC 21323]AIY06283.1 hypothetical protein Plano_2318 [Planococcus sp. PAMC 21323]